MITMHDLDEAIAECQGQPHPNANTCIKLAAFLTIKNSMLEKSENEQAETVKSPNLSYSAPTKQAVSLDSGTPFAEKISGKPVDDVLALFQEVMETLQAVNPRLYAAIMRKL